MTKRAFDVIFSFIGLLFTGLFIFIFWIIATIDTKSNGFFWQARIGQFGKVFRIYKLRTMKSNSGNHISAIGKFLRKSKIDEFPQLYNVLKGEMSIVGPRPDIAGYYDLLSGEDRKILELKPGITSLASIKYYNEVELLNCEQNPQKYNDEIIFPDKVKMNLDYYYNRSLLLDIKIIIKTIFH